MRLLPFLARTFLVLTFALHYFAQAQPAPVRILDGLRVRSDFPGGSATVLNINPTNNTVVISPAGNPDRGWPNWWYFRVDGLDANNPLVIEVVANEGRIRGNNPGEIRTLPVGWAFPDRAAVSTDGLTWTQTSPGERRGKRMVYRIAPPARILWLAWGPPFTSREANQLIQRAAKLSSHAKPFELARTLEGRPVPALRVSEPGTPEGKRFGVWIQARTHAWECGGSWISSGLTEWLVSNDPAAKSLRQKADIVIVPILDVDNVETGNGGKAQRPHEHNEDFGPSPRFPEVQAAMERITSLARAGQFDVFLDLHNPGSTGREVFVYIPPRPLLDAVRLANQAAFTNLMHAQLTGRIPFSAKIGPCGETYDPLVDKTCDAWAAYAGGSHAVSLTVETAWNTPESTQAGYRKIGEQLGRCLELYLQPSIRPGGRK